ncbi:MAG TPA: TatD family hydrolase [Kofleriaceae bacterium]|nr:TatD family hydrolase [Kofleriaceae bacterium]
MIDTHCQLGSSRYRKDRDEVMARARAAGVTRFIEVAYDLSTSERSIALAAEHDDVWATVGLHPHEVAKAPDDAFERLAELARAKEVVAIGECGLDGGTGAHALQEQIFRAHLRAARDTGKPLVIHVLRAHDAAPRLLREAGPVTGVLHSYSGGAGLVPVYRDLGLAFSFAGPVTYGNARRPIAAARAVPDALLLAETDAPDQAPEAHRGGRSEPAFVADVIAGLAAARGASADELAALTTANARRIFAAW